MCSPEPARTPNCSSNRLGQDLPERAAGRAHHIHPRGLRPQQRGLQIGLGIVGIVAIHLPCARHPHADGAGALAADGVSIYVESPGNARKLWLEGAANGKADSGKWVFPDSRFTLQNRTSGEVLAQHDVGKLACPAT